MGKGSPATAVLGLAAVATSVWAMARGVRRAGEAAVECKLQCRCGKVQGRVKTLPEDANAVRCYCESCRGYAEWLAAQTTDGSCAADAFGGSHIVQVPKTDVCIDQGLELIELARRSKKTYTMRFYASCCHTPLLNTAEFIGIVGVMAACLDDNVNKLGVPRLLFTEEAKSLPADIESQPKAKLTTALWLVASNIGSASGGPKLNYEQEPRYFGKFIKTQAKPSA